MIAHPDAPRLLSGARLSKSFPGVQALDAVDFDLQAGEVHALVGENGAGKSTLVRLIAGIVKPDGGHFLLDGHPYAPRSKAEAEAHGIRMVMQELNLIANLSIAENIFLGAMPHRFGVIRTGRMDAAAREIMTRVGLGELDPALPVNRLSIGQQQMVEIAAAVGGAVAARARCRILILDEPTASLTATESEMLFAQVELLRGRGVAIVYISHRMEEVKRLADRITVMRDGRRIATAPARELSTEDIIGLMVGRPLSRIENEPGDRAGDVALRVVGLSRGRWVREVSFEAHRGEILGFAGLMGSGRTELMRAIFGADRLDRGGIFLHGSTRPARIRSPRDAVRLGLALLTEDRKGQGLLLPASIRENISLPQLAQLARWGWVDGAAETALAVRSIQQFCIKCASAEQPASELSGGNQQKVVIAKWLARKAEVLIFDEPTRGIDVGARFDIHQLLIGLAARRKAVLVVSSDLLELMTICDRIAVMSLGRLTGILPRAQWSQEKIMALALSRHLNAKQGAFTHDESV
ncbi:MAG: sugar ABC transporter ATP-binding protein [bacterium]|nr:sugar ABC transporter ATP-binding protein [bacterium]